jgi:hypothetical protein
LSSEAGRIESGSLAEKGRGGPAMHVSQESPEQTQARLLQVIGRAEARFLPGTFAFDEFSHRDFELFVRPDTLALVRDDATWSMLVPSSDKSRELFSVFGFHFADGLDNSGFVGWLATHLKRSLGTGVFVVCGQNSRRGGIFDYWGCPAALGAEVRREVEELAKTGRML